MPKKIHNALAKQAKKMGLLGDRRDAFIYGTLAKIKRGKKKNAI